MADHRALAVSYFNAAWDLIDTPSRTPEQDQEMLDLALASRQHWREAEGHTPANLIVADWQVAHAASLAGQAETALCFAQSAIVLADDHEGEIPAWLMASVHEGMARAHATAGNRDGYEREAAVARMFLAGIGEDEDSKPIAEQLASIVSPE